MATTTCELVWISNVLKDFGVSLSLPIPLHCNNKVALHIAVNLVFHEGTKYLDIDCHLVHDYLKQGFIAPQFVHS